MLNDVRSSRVLKSENFNFFDDILVSCLYVEVQLSSRMKVFEFCDLN